MRRQYHLVMGLPDGKLKELMLPSTRRGALPTSLGAPSEERAPEARDLPPEVLFMSPVEEVGKDRSVS